MLGLKTIHFESLLQCCDLSLEPPSCKTNAPGVVKPCNGISWSNSVPYVDLRKKLTALKTIDYDTYDFCVFDDFDVYADVPMPTFTPYIYQAYGNGTKIIVTERNATEWAPRRASWDVDNHLNDSAPLAYMFSDTINDAMDADSPGNDVVSYDRSHSATTYSYLAERALIECTASPDDVLCVNIEEEANDPPKLWAKISKFLGLSTEGIQTQYFPRDTPGECHAWNVDALFSLHGDAVVQDATNPADFNYFYPVPLPVKKEYACPSSGMNVPTSPFNLVPSPQALPKPPLIKGIGPL